MEDEPSGGGGGEVIDDDTLTSGEGLELSDAEGLPDIKDAKEDEAGEENGEGPWATNGSGPTNKDERLGDEFVENDFAGVAFAKTHFRLTTDGDGKVDEKRSEEELEPHRRWVKEGHVEKHASDGAISARSLAPCADRAKASKADNPAVGNQAPEDRAEDPSHWAGPLLPADPKTTRQ